MINLAKNSGLDVRLNLSTLEIFFGADVNSVKPEVRLFSQMRDVLLNKELDSQDPLYYMYRGVFKPCDQEKAAQYRLRYDITVICPGLIGEEFSKTFGHYHNDSYPELYEVVWGEALCLMQKPVIPGLKEVGDVFLVRVKAKEKIVVPPHYGHILINPSPDAPLVMSNWVSIDCISDYSAYTAAQGAAYYAINYDGEFKFMENKFFTKLAAIRMMHSAQACGKLRFPLDEPIYNILENAPRLDFLNNPQNYNYESCFIADKTMLGAIPV